MVKEFDICSFKENRVLHGNFKQSNATFNAALKEAETSFNSIFISSNEKSCCDLVKSDNISLTNKTKTNSLSQPSIGQAERPTTSTNTP